MKSGILQILNLTICVLAISLCITCQRIDDLKYGQNYYPPDGKIHVFIGQSSYGAYLDAQFPKPWGISINTGLYDNAKIDLGGGRKYNSLGEFLRAPEAPIPFLKVYLDNSKLEPIVAGEMDSLLRALSEQLKAFEKPVFLSLGIEVNNPMYRIQPKNYIQAYRYIVTFMKNSRIKNTSFIWPIVGLVPRWESYTDPMAYFPGYAYVNWIGLTMHSILPEHFPEEEGTYFKAPNYDRIVEISNEQKIPIIICESSPRSVYALFKHSGQELWNDWYQPFLKFLKKPNVKAFSHTISNWKDEFILSKWRHEMEKEKYLHANQ